MPNVRALAATDFFRDGVAIAMFEGQVYDVPEDEAERLVADDLGEIVDDPVVVAKAQGAPPAEGLVYDEITKTWVEPEPEDEPTESSEPDEPDESEAEAKPKRRRAAK